MASCWCCSLRCCNCLVLLVALLIGLCLYQWPKKVACLNYEYCDKIFEDKPIDAAEVEARCRLSDNIGQNLQVKGFHVERNFLDPELLKRLYDTWEALPDDSVTNPGGNMGSNAGYKNPFLAGMDLMKEYPELKRKVVDAAGKISQTSDIDLFGGHSEPFFNGVFFTTNASAARSVTFPWHQDVENYCFMQDLYNLVAFYIITNKPKPNEAGLKVVPFDTLKEYSRALHDMTYGGEEPHTWMPAGPWNGLESHMMWTSNSMTDHVAVMNFTLDRLACTPDLREGDLLMFRGDLIHATQPHQSYRTSLNVLTYPIREYRIDKMFKGNAFKYAMVGGSIQNHLAQIYQAALKRGVDPAGPWMTPGLYAVHYAHKAGQFYTAKMKDLRFVLDMAFAKMGVEPF